MLDLIARPRTLRVVATHPGSTPVVPACAVHADSLVRRYRTQGPAGPGADPQCVPSNGDAPHLLGAGTTSLRRTEPHARLTVLTITEMEVPTDAANGLTRAESAVKRCKGSETVKTQRRSILLKLGARNMAQAVGMTQASSAGC